MCVCYDIRVQVHSSAYGYLVIPATFVENTILSPLHCFGTLVKNQLTINSQGLFLYSLSYSIYSYVYPYVHSTLT